MQNVAENLSNNPAELKNIIRVLTKTLNQKEIEIQKYHDHITLLEHQLKNALQFRFGKKSEKSSSDQLGLFDEAIFNEEETQAVVVVETEIQVASYTRPKNGRKALPKDLPREQIIHDLLDAQKVCACGSALHQRGEDRSEQLEFIPAQVKVIEHIRYKYACRSCCEGVKIAPVPPQPIPKSIAAPGLLAHVLVSKYNDHIPLYRQEHILQRYEMDTISKIFIIFVVICIDGDSI